MAKRDYYLIIDTETTQDNLVADFGAVLCDRQGRVIKQMGILLLGIFDNPEEHVLFHMTDDNPVFGKRTLPARYATYNKMLDSGQRMMASKEAINKWLVQCQAQYAPCITAYNFPFDRDKCEKTGIDLTIFKGKYFCLWAAASQKWAKSRKYLQFVLENHAFCAPTQLRNMTIKTNAEVMARFVLNQPELVDEPHTALEDALYYELPILKRLLATTSKRQIVESERYSWQHLQAKNFYKVR